MSETRQPHQEQRMLRREQSIVAFLLLAMCLTLAHFVHDAWYARASIIIAGFAKGPPPPVVLYAPDAYRVAMPWLVGSIADRLHLMDRTAVNAVMDFGLGFAALWVLYRVSVDDLAGAADRSRRSMTIALFLALLQFPLAWVVPWQRPETLPTALYLALALLCVARASAGRRGLWMAVLLSLTAVQALIRSDVPMIFGLAMVLLSLGEAAVRPLPSRGASLAWSAATLAIAGGVQAYLQLVRFPHLGYPPGTAELQLGNNLHFHNLGLTLLALLPLALPVWLTRSSGLRLRPVDLLVVVAAVLYFPLWFGLGIAAEVRIFVPFLLAACMVSARVVAAAWLRAEQA